MYENKNPKKRYPGNGWKRKVLRKFSSLKFADYSQICFKIINSSISVTKLLVTSSVLAVPRYTLSREISDLNEIGFVKTFVISVSYRSNGAV